MDGSVAFNGYMITGGDIAHTASGSGQVYAATDPQRITATVAVPTFGHTFALDATRPLAGTPTVLAGAYTFSFPVSPGCQCSTSASIAIVVPANGMASTLAAEDRDATRALVGTVEPASCLVAPSGRTSCSLSYHAVDPNSVAGRCEDATGGCILALTGNFTIGPDTVTGAGSFLLGNAPAIFLENGAWTAVK